MLLALYQDRDSVQDSEVIVLVLVLLIDFLQQIVLASFPFYFYLTNLTWTRLPNYVRDYLHLLLYIL